MISEVYAMAQAPSAPGQQPSMVQTFVVPMIFAFGILYFVALRPQKKKDLQHRKFLEELKKGDEVITQSGIYGRIAGVADNVITLEVADKVKIRVNKTMIAGIQPTPQSIQGQN